MAFFLLFNLINMKLRNFPSAFLLNLFLFSQEFNIVQKFYKLGIEKFLTTLHKIVKFCNFILEYLILNYHHIRNLCLNSMCLEQLRSERVTVEKLSSESGELSHDLEVLRLGFLVLHVDLDLVFLLLIVELLESFVLKDHLTKSLLVFSNDPSLSLDGCDLCIGLGWFDFTIFLVGELLKFLCTDFVPLRFLRIIESV
jgi:hypothetical protein